MDTQKTEAPLSDLVLILCNIASFTRLTQAMNSENINGLFHIDFSKTAELNCFRENVQYVYIGDEAKIYVICHICQYHREAKLHINL